MQAHEDDLQEKPCFAPSFTRLSWGSPGFPGQRGHSQGESVETVTSDSYPGLFRLYRELH